MTGTSIFVSRRRAASLLLTAGRHIRCPSAIIVMLAEHLNKDCRCVGPISGPLPPNEPGKKMEAVPALGGASVGARGMTSGTMRRWM